MNLFDAYVESLLHFNLNFYLAFSPERGRTVGELVTIISSALARSGVSCTAAEVNQSIEKRLARNDGFVQGSHDKVWLSFSLIPAPPMVPAPTRVAAAELAAAEPPMLARGPSVAVQSWEQQIWSTSFEAVAAAVHDVNAADFPIRLLVGAYSKLRNVADDPFKDEYLQNLLAVLNNLVPGSKLNRLSLDRVVALTEFGDTSTKPVKLASSRVILLLTGWVAKM
ncbi:MAG: hypothetical protein Q8M16_02980 [Pirellulaceae bacterium]|nr:hypothetical protein [Pirellulaceae bacterium]